MKIVRFEKQHLAQVGKIHAQSFCAIGQTVSDVAGFANEMSYTQVAVDEGGELLGYIHGKLQGRNAYLGWFAVKKSSRRRGTGKRLLKKFTSWARQKEARYIVLDTRNRYRDAMIMYLKSGYEVFGTFQAENGDTMIRLRMKLKTSRR